jgi:hypothetical protein
MSNPEFTAPDYTSQTAATYKANIDASIAANGNDHTNLAFTYASGTGTFTVHDAQGGALSASNPAFVRFQDKATPGQYKYISVEANQDFIDDAGSSEIINNLFGESTGVATSADVRFYLYAVTNDDMDAVQLMISRQAGRTTSPAAANIGAPDDAVADLYTDFFSLDSIDETLYDNNPCVMIGSFRMQMSASDDWTVQTIDSTDGSKQNSDRLNDKIVHSESTNQLTLPQQCLVSAKAAAQNNVTGNNTTYTIQYNSEITDRNNDFDGTSTFTAPVTGLYSVSGIIEMSNAQTGSSLSFKCVTSNRTYNLIFTDPSNVSSGATYRQSFHIIADLDAADTLTMTIQVNGVGADTADLGAGSYLMINLAG